MANEFSDRTGLLLWGLLYVLIPVTVRWSDLCGLWRVLVIRKHTPNHVRHVQRGAPGVGRRARRLVPLLLRRVAREEPRRGRRERHPRLQARVPPARRGRGRRRDGRRGDGAEEDAASPKGQARVCCDVFSVRYHRGHGSREVGWLREGCPGFVLPWRQGQYSHNFFLFAFSSELFFG